MNNESLLTEHSSYHMCPTRLLCLIAIFVIHYKSNVEDEPEFFLLIAVFKELFILVL